MFNLETILGSSIFLNMDEFSKKFDNSWDTMQSSFKKFECLQFYDETEDSPLYDLINDDLCNFSNKLMMSKQSEKPFYISALTKGVQLKRLHLISFPITKYIEFEYYSYFITNSLGEDIYYDEINKYENLDLKDFIIFDSKEIYINSYDEVGVCQGAWYLNGEKNQQLITTMEHWYDEAIKSASHFSQLITPASEILEKIL